MLYFTSKSCNSGIYIYIYIYTRSKSYINYFQNWLAFGRLWNIEKYIAIWFVPFARALRHSPHANPLMLMRTRTKTESRKTKNHPSHISTPDIWEAEVLLTGRNDKYYLLELSHWKVCRQISQVFRRIYLRRQLLYSTNKLLESRSQGRVWVCTCGGQLIEFRSEGVQISCSSLALDIEFKAHYISKTRRSQWVIIMSSGAISWISMVRSLNFVSICWLKGDSQLNKRILKTLNSSLIILIERQHTW